MFGTKRTVKYYPQMTQRDKPIKIGGNKRTGSFYKQDKGLERDDYIGKVYTEKYPTSIITFSNRCEPRRSIHQTKKPVALMEYLIRTYSKEGDLVLDSCMGSGTTGIAATNTGRSFIGIELDEKIYSDALFRHLDCKIKVETAW